MSDNHQQTSNFNPAKGEGAEVGVAILGYGTVGSQVLRLMQENADEFAHRAGGVKRVRSVPVLSWVQAGVFAQTGDMEYDTTAPLYDDSYPDDVYWLTVKGNSMEPRFSQGDLLLIDPSRQATGGDFVIACEIDTGSITFKRLRIGFDESTGQDYYQLVPLNDNYAVIDSRYKDFEIQGVVVERKEILI